MFPTADSETEDITQGTSLNRKTSLLSNERDSSESSQVAKQNNYRESTLNMLIKELVICIALALTTYGALHNANTNQKTQINRGMKRF
ncbi:jg10785 [Pararge aegeria aegeria]|uniref:Jg10785 protein n=1 Tax=Pararge aegeria aegeria TaxID=348720 RepID=A0A8S4S8K9_9NEOP|nr:jg10785 [Pararge aegeria aegeria]